MQVTCYAQWVNMFSSQPPRPWHSLSLTLLNPLTLLQFSNSSLLMQDL